MQRARIRYATITVVAMTTAACGGPPAVLNESVSPVATSTALSSTPAPETFRVKGCDAATGGGGKNVAPFIRDVRVGKQDDFDRVTFEFGPDAKSTVPFDELTVPKYTVVSASSVPAGPKGETVKVAGSALLAVWLQGAYAHESDKPTRSYPGPGDITPKDFPILAEAKQGEDSDGNVRWALGLTKERCPEVSTLTDPPRLVVDLPY